MKKMKNFYLSCILCIVKLSQKVFDLFIKKSKNKGEKKMTHEFYDVKEKQKVVTEVTEKTTYGEGTRVRYAVKGKTKDGRNLTAFVSKTNYDKIKVK